MPCDETVFSWNPPNFYHSLSFAPCQPAESGTKSCAICAGVGQRSNWLSRLSRQFSRQFRSRPFSVAAPHSPIEHLGVSHLGQLPVPTRRSAPLPVFRDLPHLFKSGCFDRPRGVLPLVSRSAACALRLARGGMGENIWIHSFSSGSHLSLFPMSTQSQYTSARHQKPFSGAIVDLESVFFCCFSGFSLVMLFRGRPMNTPCYGLHTTTLTHTNTHVKQCLSADSFSRNPPRHRTPLLTRVVCLYLERVH